MARSGYTRKERETIGSAWAGLVYIADRQDHSAPILARDAMERQRKDTGEVSLAQMMLVSAALSFQHSTAELYGFSRGSQLVQILAAHIHARQPSEFVAWVKQWETAVAEVKSAERTRRQVQP